MLEIGCVYSKPELTQMLGTRSKQGIDRKLDRYGVVYEVCGRGESAVYTIKAMADPFKVFAITELGFDGGTDFTKLRNFYYHFFEDDIFMAMPDEVKEVRMRAMGQNVSRQTIATYTRRLEVNDLINRNTKNFVYYDTMYLDGYTPEQIMTAFRKKLYRECEERREANEIPNVKIISEVKVR